MSDIGLGTGEAPERPHRPKRVRGCLAVFVAILVLVGIGGFVYVQGVDTLRGWLASTTVADYDGQGHGSVTVRVKEGDTSAAIGETLAQADVVKSAQAFVDAAKDDARALTIQVGYYKMRKQMSGANALDLMLDPASRVSVGFTVVEGERAKEIAAAMVARTRFNAEQVAAAFADTESLGLPTYAKNDPEGYLFPATYPITPGTRPTPLLQAMVKRFDQEAESLDLVKNADALNITPGEAVIVASLVQAEAGRPQDMPKVARVIYNRLKVGMALQLDSTLHYAVDSRGVVTTDEKLRSIDSPYNTYKYTGLPPTPIGQPGEDALKAALHPAAGSWRYFVTVNLRTGETLFSTTYDDFLADSEKYHEYCQTSKAC